AVVDAGVESAGRLQRQVPALRHRGVRKRPQGLGQDRRRGTRRRDEAHEPGRGIRRTSGRPGQHIRLRIDRGDGWSLPASADLSPSRRKGTQNSKRSRKGTDMLWKLVPAGGIVAPNERLPWPQTIGIGMQHVVAMFGATFLVPLITGFPPTTTILFSGIGTLVFLVVTRNKIPSYLGSSFAFISPVIASMGADKNIGLALTGIFAAGCL